MTIVQAIGGGGAGVTDLIPTAVKTSSYTVAGNQLVPVDTTSGTVPLTLPVAVAGQGAIGVKHVAKGAGNAVTVATVGSDVFNVAGGSVLLTLPKLAQSVRLTPGNGIWYVAAADIPLSQVDGRPSWAAAGSGIYRPEGALYNFTESSLRYARAAIARQQTGGAACHIMDWGDSTVTGVGDGSAPGVAGTTQYLNAPAGVLRTLLDLLTGKPCGTGIVLTSDATFATATDTRYVETPALSGVGDGFFNVARQFSSGQVVTFGPITCDTVTIWYRTLTAGNSPGSVTVVVDPAGANVTLGTISGAGASVYSSTSFAIPAGLGSHTIQITGPGSSQTFRLLGIEGIITQTGGYRVTKNGYGSQTSTQMIANQASPMLTLTAPDIVFIDIGINDYILSATPAVYLANLLSAVNLIRALPADPIFRVPHPTGAAGDPVGQLAYYTQIYEAADALNVAVVDNYARWQSVNLADAIGYYYETGGTARTHGTAKGYADEAHGMFNALRTIL